MIITLLWQKVYLLHFKYLSYCNDLLWDHMAQDLWSHTPKKEKRGGGAVNRRTQKMKTKGMLKT